MIDSVIHNLLTNTPVIRTLLDVNIYPGVAAQSDLTSYAVYHLIDIVPENTKDGVAVLDVARVQVDCFNPEKDVCDQIAKAIRGALDRYRGTVNRLTIDKIIFQDARNDFDEDRKIYQVSQDFIIRHKR